jgi:hypothetical protein
MTHEDPLLACLQGRISPEVAIARLVLAGDDAAAIRRRVNTARDTSAAWVALDRLAGEAPLDLLRRMLDAADVDHAEASTPGAIAALFDRAVTISPEASVAMYSLGDPDRLRLATDEIVAWLRQRHVVDIAHDVLDLGCGIGRVAAALAPHVRSVLAIDNSAGMLREARMRCKGLRNVAFALISGVDLAALADHCLDTVVAVDSFPYLVQAGVAEHHVSEAHRVLRTGGHLVLFNLSYRRGPEADRTTAGTWALRYGFALLEAGVAPFRTWDASAFVFRRM